MKRLPFKHGPMSYKKRLMAYLLSLSVLTLLMAFVTLGYILNRIILDSESRNLRQLVSVVNDDIENRLGSINTTGFDIVIDSNIRESLNPQNDLELSRSRTRIESIIKIKLISSNFFSSITILDKENHVFSPNVSLILPDDFQLEKTDVYRTAAEGHGSLVWLSKNDLLENYALHDMYRPDSDIHAAAVIVDYYHNKLMGFIMFTLNKSYFSDISYADNLLSGNDLYLVSPDKERVFTVADTKRALPDGVLDRLSFTDEKMEFTMDGRLLVCEYNNNMGWYLVSMTEMETLAQGMLDILMVLAVVLVIFILLSIIFARQIAIVSWRGMDELIAGMERLEREDFNIEVPVVRQDELGRVIRAFNQMAKRIKDLINIEYREKLLVREAQFKALQSQINPHFLMNTFDMLRWKLLDKGEGQLSETVVALSHLMQYSMNSRHWHVSLSDEIQNVQEYLSVHTVIRDCHIEIKLDVRHQEEICLPRQTLQPIVENSIKHGFGARKHGNMLRIFGDYFSEEQDLYQIIVEDNGLGISEEELEAVNCMVNSDTNPSDEHIGLNNVAARLRYMDENARVIISSCYGSGTRVEMRFHNKVEGNT